MCQIKGLPDILKSWKSYRLLWKEMSLIWTIIASGLYAEIFMTILLVIPNISNKFWCKIINFSIIRLYVIQCWGWRPVEMFYLNSTLNFGIPLVLVFQLEVYYKIDRLLTGLTAQQKGTTARWYSNKTSLIGVGELIQTWPAISKPKP